MAETTTFIKIDRNIRNWRWYQDSNTMRVFLDLLINANISDCDCRGVTIHRGEIATSYASIAERLGLTVKQARVALDHLKRTGEVAVKIYPKFQVISILCYDKYQTKGQGIGHPKGRQRAGKGQQSKNNKNNKNIKENSGADVSPLIGERPPAIGDDGDEYIEIDGILHRFPASWYSFAEKNEMSIEDYVRKRHR